MSSLRARREGICIGSTLIMTDTDIIEEIDLPDIQNKKNLPIDTWVEELSLDEAKGRIEKAYIERALDRPKTKTSTRQLAKVQKRSPCGRKSHTTRALFSRCDEMNRSSA